MPNCLVVQHVEPEPAFVIGEWLFARAIDVDVRRVFAGEPVPRDPSGFDGLVVMGGPMSAGSDRGFPTRRIEVGLLAGAIDAGIPTLGVCLGAQLLAVAGGGSVSVGATGPEIGWDPVQLLEGARDDPLLGGLPDELTVLHWHGDTFELPPGASRLVANDRYTNQGFRLGEMAWGLQFHLEVTESAVEGFLRAFAADAADAGGADRIRSATPGALAELGPARDLVLSRFADLVSAPVRRTDLVGGGGPER